MASAPGDEGGTSSFRVVVKTMFGEYFNLTVTNADTVKDVKQKITSKLNIPEEGFTLLNNASELTDGSVEENGINKDSQLTLALRIQTGMKGFATVTNPFLTIDQSLNHLSDKQIDEFLTGKVPLSVALRLGDAMLVINIQSSLATKDDDDMDNSKVDTEDMSDLTVAQPAVSNTVLPNTLNCTGFPLYADDSDSNTGSSISPTEKLINSARRDTIKNTLYDMLSRMFPDGIQTFQQVKKLRPGEILNNKTGKVTYQVKQNQDMLKLSQADRHASVLTKSKFEENQKLREKVALLKQKMAVERSKKKAQRGAGHSPCGWLEKSLQKHSQSSPLVHVQKRQGYCGLKRGFLLTD